MSKYVELKAAMVVQKSEKALLIEVLCTTEHKGNQTAMVWVPKSQACGYETEFISLASWLVEAKEKEIAREYGRWGCVGICVVEENTED